MKTKKSFYGKILIIICLPLGVVSFCLMRAENENYFLLASLVFVLWLIGISLITENK